MYVKIAFAEGKYLVKENINSNSITQYQINKEMGRVDNGRQKTKAMH